jgi:XTP/dITP diphosphohydrolase
VTRLLVATRNRGKQAEFRLLLEPLAYDIVFPDDVGLAETPDEVALEAFDTLRENARAKSDWFAARSGLPALADDSGLEVDALGGAPGVHSRRFAGAAGPDREVAAANNAKLLARLAGMPDERRTARFRCVLVLSAAAAVDGTFTGIVVSGTTEGRITAVPYGDRGFGYDPLFFSPEIGMTFGQADVVAKQAVSHRGRAVAALAAVLRGRDVVARNP